MCDRVIFLYRGRIVMQGSPAGIIRESKSRSLEDLFITISRKGHLYHAVEEREEEPCGSE
jgi:ABC-type Na+ transport system ATPase subunit NatA